MTNRLAPLALLVLAIVAGCAGASAGDVTLERAELPAATTAPPATTVPPTTAPPATAPVTTVAPPASIAAPPPPAPPTTTPVVRPRVVHEQPWTPFAAVGGVTLRHPSARVERVGFHESGHDGARDLEPLPTAAAPIVLDTRDRGTGARTAADVVVDPDVEIRAPVSGQVKRAGTYVLYCDHSDDFAVIEPDDRPGWEVKVLHISGVLVRTGDRVVAGETVLAPRPTRLPFESQVEETAAKPPWPHVHIEVVDPSIPDRPSGRGC